MKKRVPWFLIFSILFLLSLDYWSWDEPLQFAFLNLPSWIYYFGLLQLLLAAAVYIFSKKFW